MGKVIVEEGMEVEGDWACGDGDTGTEGKKDIGSLDPNVSLNKGEPHLPACPAGRQRLKSYTTSPKKILVPPLRRRRTVGGAAARLNTRETPSNSRDKPLPHPNELGF
jgi:hypothetical protein